MTPALLSDIGAHRLFVSGALHEGDETVFLLSPDEPGFWAHVTAEAEFADGAPDPIDRWSRRVIEALAGTHGGRAAFPFGGPPFAPFFRWACESGQAFTSPIHLLVHARMGLWASYRGALIMPGHVPLPPAAEHPCTQCPAPCRTQCPVGAFTLTRYETDICHGFLDSADGTNCLLHGCLARRACPIGQGYGRLSEQSSWHMRHFHP